MTVTELTQTLRRLRVGGWSVWQRRSRNMLTTGDAATDESESTETVLAIDRDIGRDRGTGEVRMLGTGRPADLIDAAWAAAAFSVGPAWETPPAAAAARVELGDPSVRIDDGWFRHAVKTVSTAAVAARIPAAMVGLEAEEAYVEVATSAGLSLRWRETLIAVTDLRPTHTGWRHARRRWSDLNLSTALGAMAARRSVAATTKSIQAKECAVAFDLAAYAHGGSGLLAAVVAQHNGDARGTTRYSLGAEIVAGAATRPFPFDLMSDGAKPFGLLSQPVGTRGEPVRRFSLVKAGRAAGLGLTHRAAALRNAAPNGGVRNLVVAPGGETSGVLLAPCAVHVHSLDWLEINLDTGMFAATIDSASEREGGEWKPRRGGLIEGDAIALLAMASRSSSVEDQGIVHGPSLVRVDAMRIQ